MTRTPHLHALAMRTKAARIADNVSRGQYHMDDAPIAIIALPLEADHAALLAEAVKLPEIAALIEAASEQAGYMSLLGDDGDLLRNLVNALQPFLALETP